MDGEEQRRRGLSFGVAAEAYERYRLGYPDEVVDRVLAHAARPVRTAVEIGAGTGKATRMFVGAGVHVLALEPDPAMLAVLRREVGGDVVGVLSSFEAADLEGTVDLVYAASALHWTDPTTRWSRVAGLLAPGGVFASFGGSRDLADPALRDAVRRVREPVMGDDDVPSPDGTPREAAQQWPGTELDASPWFSDVEQVRIARRTTTTGDDFVGHLSTISAYLVLPDETRSELLARIRSVLPDRVDLEGDVVLHLARRSHERVAP